MIKMQRLPDVFLDCAELDALGCLQTYSSGTNCETCYCREIAYGIDHLGSRSGWNDCESGCFHCEELSERQGNITAFCGHRNQRHKVQRQFVYLSMKSLISKKSEVFGSK